MAKKPGLSADCDAIFPIFWQKAMAVSMVDCDVCNPVMISTPFWMGTGFMKCVEMTREDADRSVGFSEVLAAILVMLIDDVFVARMVCDGQI